MCNDWVLIWVSLLLVIFGMVGLVGWWYLLFQRGLDDGHSRETGLMMTFFASIFLVAVGYAIAIVVAGLCT